MSEALFKADIIKMVNVAQAPVSLVIATSIFLHMMTSRYVPMHDRLRALVDEYRQRPHPDRPQQDDSHSGQRNDLGGAPYNAQDPSDNALRAESVKQQIQLYGQRIAATQAASLWLNLSVISFLGTVSTLAATVIYPNNFPLRLAGMLTMALGIVLLLVAIGCELYEAALSRKVLGIELAEFSGTVPKHREPWIHPAAALQKETR